MKNDFYPLGGALRYFLGNCRFALDKLHEVNKKFRNADGKELNSLGREQRVLAEYLIVRLASLFDQNKKAVSFENLCSDNKKYKNIKHVPVIKYVIDMRHNFVAHANFRRMMDGNFPSPAQLLNSNLRDLIEKLEKIAAEA